MSNAQPLSLAELLTLLPRIQATLQLLVGHSAQLDTVRVSSGSANGAGPRRRRSRGSDLPDKLLAVLKTSKSGYSLGDLVKRVGADRGAVKYHLRALRSSRKARVKGTRKTAVWLAA